MCQLEDRVTALEKSARRWRLAAGALGVTVLAALAIAAAPGGKLEAPAVVADEIRVKRLVVVDDQGTQWIVADHSGLSWRDRGKNSPGLISLGQGKYGPTIVIQDRSGTSSLTASSRVAPIEP